MSTYKKLTKASRRKEKLKKAESTVLDFHYLWYQSKVWKGDVTWEEIAILKNPMDLWMYQNIVMKTKPDLIIETGTHLGGSALYFARLLDILGAGTVATVDIIDPASRPEHPRIQYLTGSSTSLRVTSKLAQLASESQRVMVVLDSDHSKDHVHEELVQISRFVTVGCYLVVEDTNVNGHPVKPNFGPGPMEAVDEFLASNNNFVVDRDCENYFLTFNPSGWLRRL